MKKGLTLVDVSPSVKTEFIHEKIKTREEFNFVKMAQKNGES